MEQSAKNSQDGNTIAVLPFQKSRAYIITIFNDELKHFDKAIYECWCNDTCKDGKPHMHQVIYFKNPISFKSVKKVYPTAHIERCHNIEDAIHYILDNKNGSKFNITESGKRPEKHKFEKMSDFKDVDSDDIPPYMYSAYSKYKNRPKKLKVDEWHKDIKVFYISGPSGIGKSKKAFELMKANNVEEFDEIKYENGFYNGVSDGIGCAVYDDFRDSVMKANEFINLIDYNIHNLNIKGGNVKNKYNLIIITSIIRLDDLYKKMPTEAREQWMRRVEYIDLYVDDEALI